MATVNVVFENAHNVGGSAVHAARPRAVEDFTSSGTSQATTITASVGEVASITSVGGAIWAKVAGTPTAAAGSDHLIADGETKVIGPLNASDKVAIIDA